MFETMKKLITKKYYATAEAAKTKVNTFYAFDDLTEDEAIELKLLIVETYVPAPEVPQ